MAITTLDGAIAGQRPPDNFQKVGAATVVGRLYSPFYVAGMPGAAVAPSPGVAGAALTSYSGQIPFTNPGSGNSYLYRFQGDCNVAGTLYVCDRLWHNSGLSATLTTAQTVNSVAWPARDRDGSTNGVDVQIGFEVSTVMGAGTPTFTMNYTNAAGTAGRSITTAAQSATMAVGSFIPIPLAAGDTGVRSIQAGWQLSATMTSGAYHLVAYLVLARLPVVAGGIGGALDFITGGGVRMYDNTVPFLLWLPATTTAPTISGSLQVTQG